MSDKKAQPVEKAVERTANILMYICMGMLAVMMFLGSADVIGRYLFNKPIAGTYEIFEMLLPMIVLVGLAYLQVKEGQIRVHFIFLRLSPRAQAIVSSVTTLIAIALFVLLVWRGTLATILSFDQGRYYRNIFVPVYLVQMFIPLGALFTLPVMVIQLLKQLAKIRIKGTG